ncbi:MAG: transglutaminase domain-containing protein [Eubacteriales bacterium]|nr:transglutaminase domain-containing protein [Eubacteriales bacterium]
MTEEESVEDSVMKRLTTAFLLFFIFACIMIVAYLYVPDVQEKFAYITEENFVEENIYSNLDGISERLDEEIMKGSESFIIYLKDMDVNEINQINASMDGVFGSGKSYQQLGMIGTTYKKIEITVKKSTNYYVYAAYRNRVPIPEDERDAKKLYATVKNIMDTQITDEMSDYEKELALHDYLTTHCVYSEDANQGPDSDIYRAYGALVNGNAVCNGYAEAMQILLMCAGVNTKFVTGKAGNVDHAWNLVELDGQWYHMDATWDDPKPDQGQRLLHPYFNVTDEIMGESHIWNRERYPNADSMTYNYYKQSNAYFINFADYKNVAATQLANNPYKRYEAVIENYEVKDEDMRFVFDQNRGFRSISWQNFNAGDYNVLVLSGE